MAFVLKNAPFITVRADTAARGQRFPLLPPHLLLASL